MQHLSVLAYQSSDMQRRVQDETWASIEQLFADKADRRTQRMLVLERLRQRLSRQPQRHTKITAAAVSPC